MSSATSQTRQSGQALWLFLLIIALSAGLTLSQRATPFVTAPGRDTRLAALLAQAKEALLARAVTDDNRPGSLPCPDLITNSVGLSNFPGDGKADMFTLTQCPSYVGWLPWITLDLPELVDDSGTRLWYVLSPTLRDDDSAQPINSDTVSGLTFDGRDDVVALIIAPGAPLAGQHRPSNNPADYLDGENGNGNDHRYISGPASELFNDRVLAITRQEWMAAVGKRVASELKSCLDQHAASAANPEQRYPWPAPLSSSGANGRNGSLFGRIPETQASSGLQSGLSDALSDLARSNGQLLAATDPATQLARANELAEQLVHTRNLLDAAWLAASGLKQTADDAVGQLQKIDSSIDSASSNDRISVTEGRTIRTLSQAADAFLITLPARLSEQGLDPLPWKLRQQAGLLASLDTASLMLATSQTLINLLAGITTPRTDLAQGASDALNAAFLARSAAEASLAAPGDSRLLTVARNASLTLVDQLNVLASRIDASRLNLLSSQVFDMASAIEQSLTTYQDTATPANRSALKAALEISQTALARLSAAQPAISTLRSATLQALSIAAGDAGATPENRQQTVTDTQAAVTATRTLAEAIKASESIDNNVTHTSVLAAVAAFTNTRERFNEFDTRSPRPVQSQIVPYARNLQDAAVNLGLWAKTISEHMALIAPLARALPLAAGSSPDKAVTLQTSAYQSAADTLNGIVGKNHLLTLIQSYLDTPSTSNRNKVASALNDTQAQISVLNGRLTALAQTLTSTSASAGPMIWGSSRCDFLRPGVISWWQANAWASGAFYQLAHPLATAPESLTINGHIRRRRVVILGGPPLNGQHRPSGTPGDYLEDANADPSRSGDATAPSPSFRQQNPSADFNDRLAY